MPRLLHCASFYRAPPVPASRYVVSAGGYWGALIALWLGFTLPSAGILLLVSFWIANAADDLGYYWIKALKLVAVMVVAEAV